MQRVNIGLVCLSWLVLASAVSAQTAVDPASDAGLAAIQNFSGGGMLQGTYFDIRHQTGDGVGYRNSFSQIGAFTPFWLNEDAFIATNSRLILTNSTQVGVNTGLVGRRYVANLDRIFGAYGFYDNDEDSLNYRYSQFTLGAETLGQWWDLRANGYFLNGMRENLISCLGVGGNPYYTGNEIAFRGYNLVDQAMGGGDAEFGVPVSPYTQWLRAYSGIYAYRTSQQETFGYRGRVEAMVSNDLTLGVMVSQDRLWGTNVNATIDFKFSGFQPTRYFPNVTTRQRMLNPVQRNWRVATHTYVQGVDVAAVNPATDRPYFVTHVQQGAQNGDGTYQHPFNSLPNSAPGDIILVHGANSSPMHPIMGSITLADHQRLLGDGKISAVDLFVRYCNTIVGTYNLPGTTNSGQYPVLSSNGNIVTLTNNNEVAGLTLINAGGNAITNTPSGSNNFLLQCLQISNNQGAGISLQNASGSGIISGINVDGMNHPNPMGFGGNAGGGIQISSGGFNPDPTKNNLDLFMNNVYMNGDQFHPQKFGVSLTALSSNLNVNMNNVFTNGNGTGIQLSENSEQLTANMNLVRANNNNGVGIQVSGVGGSISITGDNVLALNNGSDNLQIGSKAAPIVTSTVGVTFNDASFSNSVNGSGVVFSQSGGVGTLNLTNSYVFGNGSNGLAIYSTNGSLMNANVLFNLLDSQKNNLYGPMQGNFGDGFHVESSSASTVNLYVNHMDASSSGGNGLYYKLDQGSTFNVMFLNSNLNNSGQRGLYGQLDNNSVVNMFFDNTTARNSGTDGFFLDARNNSFANVEIDHGSFANSGRLQPGYSAIAIRSDNSTINFLANKTPGNNIQPNGMVGNQAYGLFLNLMNNTTFNGNIYNSDFSDTLGDAVNVGVVSGSTANLTLLNTPGERSGFDGFVANVDNAQLTTSFTNSNFDSSGRDGMHFSVSNGGILNSQFNNGSSFNNSGRDGIYGSVTGANSSATIAMMNGSDINNSGQHGIEFIVNAGTLNVADYSSSISNNGLSRAVGNGTVGGVEGSGVLGVVNNAGVVRLDFANSAINNNLDNGVFVTSTTGSIVEASFNLGSVNGNGTTARSLHGNDGIKLNISDSPYSSLQVYNGTTINGNGNDGISILASNQTNFVGSIGTDLYGTLVDNPVSILNNGSAPPSFVGTRAGLNVTTESQSLVNLKVDGATIGNTGTSKAQQIGILFDANTGGALNLSLTSANLSNNGSDAINGSVSGPGSIADITMNNVTGNTSGATGAIFNISGGGQLNVISNITNVIPSSFSQNGGSGILVQVDGANSQANFDLASISLNGNGTAFGGQGFNGLATNGGTLNVCLESASINSNANQGLLINVLNANSVANFNVQQSTINTNGSQGLSINVQDQGVVNYRSQNNTYDGNGTNGKLDGIQVTAIGNGPADSATARLLFSTDAIDANKGNGLSLTAQNGATLTTTIENGGSISNNGGYGIQNNATGANTSFNLLMDGTTTISGNKSGSFSPYVFSNLKQIVLDITSSASNSATDGIHVDLQNVTNAVVSIQGPGLIDNNAGDGINVNMQNITNGSLLINGVTAIDNNTLDGIHVNFNSVANGAIQIEGPTDVSNNGNNGINITLLNSNLVNNLNFGGATVVGLTLNDNLASPLGGCLPAPVTFALNSLGNVPVNALTIDKITATGNAGDGILITGTTSNIAANGSFITNNVVSGSTSNAVTGSGGDGLHLNFHTVTADGLVISNNGFQANAGNGINLELFNSPINNLTITNNTGGSNGLAGTLNFNYTANGPLNQMLNTSTAGINIANVTLNLAPSKQYFRGDQTLTPSGTYGFYPAPNTDVTTGLDSVNGVAITPGNYPVQDTNGNVLPYGGVPVDSQLLSLGFNNFTPAAFALDYFLAHGQNSSVGNTINTSIVGSTGTVTLTDGRKVSGVIKNINGFDQLQINQNFAAITSGISSNGLDGIRFNLNNSSLTNLNVSNNTISSNGTSSAVGAIGHGIEFTGATGAVVNSDITNAVFNANTINSNTGDGIRIVNPTTVGNTISTVFSGNNINLNKGTGINLSLVNGAENLRASFASNTITQNAGGPGVNIQLADNRNMTGGFDNNVITSNGAQGVNIVMGVNGVLTSNFTTNVINGNKGDGINISLNTGGHFEGAQFYGNTIGTTASRNGGLGVRLTVPDQASFNWNLGDTTQAANLITGNSNAGVGITMTGASTGTLNIANSSLSNTIKGADQNFNGEGLKVNMQGSSILTGGIVESNFTNNAGDGALFTVTGNNAGQFAQLDNFTVGGATTALGNNFSSNGGNGLEFFRTANGQINNIIIQNSVFDSNQQNGLVIRAANQFRTDTYTINNNDISKNSQDGLLFDERADANISANMNLNTIENNGANGIHLIEQINAGVDGRALTGTWTQNLIANNKANGIALDGEMNDLLIGDPTNTNLGNVITLNSQNGIEVSGYATLLTIGSNMITQNGTLANLNTAAENAGVLMAVAPASDIIVENNLITNNFGDGVQYQIRQNFDGFTTQVSIHDNQITDNSGRGINLINRADNHTQADIYNNFISANKLEGIYVVNTSSSDQAIWASSTTPLLADGGISRSPILELRFVNNQVIGNGINSGLGGTGLVIRVGTSDGGFGPRFAGGFASGGTQLAEGGSPFGLNSGFGGVTAVVDDNRFGGNFGNDVLFHSFVSTVAPITAAGTWDNTQYTVNAYQGDPLSRFDLYFRANITDANSVDTNGNSIGAFGQRNPALAAFYNDADGVFKSRLNTITAPNIAGPFNNAGRARNATRLAARIPFYNAPNVGPGLNQLYPGMGASTWRVSSDSENIFPLDVSPYTTTNDANGYYLPFVGNNGELPFGYGSF
jgi:trimeric autotransporter adhesin